MARHKIYHPITEWRKSAGFTQETLANALGRDQRTVSMYERGAASIPEDLQVRFRELGYTGPFTVSKAAELPTARNVLSTARGIVVELERRGFKAESQAQRDELLDLVVDEVERSIASGRPETALELVDRWMKFARTIQRQ